MALLLGLRSKIRNAAATTIVANTIAIGFAALFLLGRRDGASLLCGPPSAAALVKAASDCWSALERLKLQGVYFPAHEQEKTGDVGPEQGNNDGPQRAIGRVIGAEIRNIETTRRRQAPPWKRASCWTCGLHPPGPPAPLPE